LATRRQFIRNTAFTTASLLISRPLIYAEGVKHTQKLIILHTNDVHSRLDPFPDGQYAGKGGVAARAKLIREIRAAEDNVLLVDAGDIFQGTPYFNIYKGEPELQAMSMMGYEAGTIGNHDFDAGIENLAEKISAHANFPFIICNYDFRDTPMETHYHPYQVIRKGKLTIGITGVGIEMMGLVGQGLYGTTKYLDPVMEATKTAEYLKKKKNCDMVICLSHLGDKYTNDKISDELLAQRSRHIDLIIGAHTHKFFEVPRVYRNADGEEVVVNQVGWGGIQLGRLDYVFEAGKEKNLEKNKSILIGKNTGE
jgi:5'-nucleotidase